MCTGVLPHRAAAYQGEWWVADKKKKKNRESLELTLRWATTGSLKVPKQFQGVDASLNVQVSYLSEVLLLSKTCVIAVRGTSLIPAACMLTFLRR